MCCNESLILFVCDIALSLLFLYSCEWFCIVLKRISATPLRCHCKQTQYIDMYALSNCLISLFFYIYLWVESCTLLFSIGNHLQFMEATYLTGWMLFLMSSWQCQSTEGLANTLYLLGNSLYVVFQVWSSRQDHRHWCPVTGASRYVWCPRWQCSNVENRWRITTCISRT